MFFASDNWAGAHPDIAKSLVDAAGGFTSAYGTGDLDKRVEKTFSEIFERDVAVSAGHLEAREEADRAEQ